jgi:hypothetical protein
MIDISTKKFWLPMLLSICSPEIHAQRDGFKSVQVQGMRLQWSFEKETLKCIVTAPTIGWVAVGFNVKDELTGTHLIMGAMEEDFLHLDDRFIVRPGIHKSIAELGGSDSLMKRSGFEQDGNTILRFSIPLSVNDKYHHNLTEGKEYYVLLAYSQEDDFQHHSSMRTTIKIKL